MIEAFEDGILEGVAISQICLNIGIAEVSFYRHRLEDADFESTIVRAQEQAQEVEVDRMLALADSADAENYNAIKLKIWARMWIAGKRKPKKYGDKMAVTGADGGAIQIVSTIPRPPKEGE